ncbi:MAG: hypothetical protein U0T73_09140 [Chitinophagales bacterium]
MSKNVPVQFSIHSIITTQFAIIKECYDVSQPIKLKLNAEIKAAPDNNSLQVNVNLQLQQKQPFLVLETECSYQIAAQSWLVLTKNKSVIIPKDFAQHLTMLTLGTVRGILHAKIEMSDFRSYVLPPIDVTQIIPKDIELHL